jgi:peptidoglycan/LPS O-acetylase OafA/YrhL
MIAGHCGWLGVDLFFVLSGFLITSALVDTADRSSRWRDFYARRVLRIFPLYYGVLAVVFWIFPHLPALAPSVASAAPHQVWFWTYTVNLLPSLGAFSDPPGIRLGHFWSLAIEEQFYLVWPLIVWRSGARLASICLGIVVASLALRLAFVALGGSAVTEYVATPMHMDGLAAGAWLASQRGQFSELGHRARWTAAASFAGLVLLVARYGAVRDSAIGMALVLSAAAIFFGSALLLAETEPVAGRILSIRPLRVLGKYSYGLYVMGALLQPQLESAGLATARLIPYVHSKGLAAALHFGGHVAVYLALAMLVYHLYEEPFLRLKDRFGVTRAEPQPAS